MSGYNPSILTITIFALCNIALSSYKVALISFFFKSSVPKSTTHKAVYVTVSISIGDVNDNSPQFVNAPYAGIVPENSPTGLTVLRVTAEDADLVRKYIFLEFNLIRLIFSSLNLAFDGNNVQRWVGSCLSQSSLRFSL